VLKEEEEEKELFENIQRYGRSDLAFCRTFYITPLPVGRIPTVWQHSSATVLQSNINPAIYTFLHSTKSTL
jgi:hypothetical protein